MTKSISKTAFSKEPQATIELYSDANPKVQTVLSTPYSFTRLSPAKVTPVFDTYWRFAAERQRVFFNRIGPTRGPWTNDPILNIHKFTNAYRASDRTSQYLIKNVIYRDDLPNSAVEIFFRIILFKLFNKIETWELFERVFGEITVENYSFKKFDKVLSNARAKGDRVYSAAYIMPPGSKSFGMSAKHQNHLLLLEMMMEQRVPDRLAQMPSMQDGFECLKSYPTIGDFLAYQFVTDLNYSQLTDFSEMDFVIPGPGARDGIRKCFADYGGLTEPEIIRLMADRQEEEFDRLGLKFHSLWGRPLQLIDCQNLFCEVDKYARVAHPEISGISGRTRIKQKFVPKSEQVNYFYPPKWAINDQIELKSVS